MVMARSAATGGSTTGLSATDAWIGALSVTTQFSTMVEVRVLFSSMQNPSQAWRVVTGGVDVNPLRFACRTFQRARALHVRDAKP